MPSEAIAIREQTPHPDGTYQRWLGNVLYGQTPILFGGDLAERMNFLRKPATVVNPIRKDGTRPMSAYSTEWFRLAPAKTITSARPISSYQDRYLNFPALPVRRESPGLTMEQIRRTWMVNSPLDILGADGEARTNTLSKLSQKKWDLGVAAGELKQTAGLVTDLAQSMLNNVDKAINSRKRMKQQLHRFFRRVQQHGDFYQAAAEVGLKDISLLEDLKNGWMQYSLGVKPMLRDIHDSGQYLSDLLFKDKVAVIMKVKAGAQRGGRFRKKSDADSYMIDPVTRYYHGTATCNVHYTVVYEMPIGGVGPITELGLDNPYSTLWELTTLSWMFDYVVGVGDWLSSLTATKGLVFREGCRSELRRCLIDTVELQKFQNAEYIRPAGPLGIYLESGQFDRTLLSAAGLMPAMVPAWKSSLGLVQMGQSLFALSNLLQGKPGLS